MRRAEREGSLIANKKYEDHQKSLSEDNNESFYQDDVRGMHGKRTFSKICRMIHKYQGETIRILFDLQMLILWAQLHPCTEAFRAMTPYCRNGESELDLLLRDPTEEDANVIVPRWPQIVTDGFGLDKSVYVRKIAIV